MTVSSALLQALEVKTGLTRRSVNRLIAEKAAALYLPREQAAIALAIEYRVNVNRFATPDDLAAIRHATNGTASASTAPVSEGSPRPVRKTATRAPKASGGGARRTSGASTKKVLVVHGRDEEARRSMFAFLRAIGLQPLEWSTLVANTGSGSPYPGEVLDKAFDTAKAVVVLLTPDDEVRLREPLRKRTDPAYESVLTGQARPNVLFEAGMALGRTPKQTIIVQLGDVRKFSDVAGRHIIHMDNSAEMRLELATRLRTAGCDVDTDGPDWLKEGTFDPERAKPVRKRNATVATAARRQLVSRPTNSWPRG